MPIFGHRKPKPDPVKEFMSNWKPHEFTPDFPQLEMRHYQNVFLYNEIMTGHQRHEEFITPATIALGTAFTQASNFQLWMKRTFDSLEDTVVEGVLPIALEAREPDHGVWFKTTHPDPMRGNSYKVDRAPHPMLQPEVCRIKGELYSFKPHQLLGLDKYLKNTVEFERQRVKTVIFYYKHNKDTDEWTRSAYIIRAWMYIGKPEYWEPLVDGGYLFSLAPRFTPPEMYLKMSDYYWYEPK